MDPTQDRGKSFVHRGSVDRGGKNREMLVCFSGTLDGVLWAYNVQPNSLNPQVCFESSFRILRVGERTPDEVVLAVFPHGGRTRDSVVLKARTKLCFTDGCRKVRDENGAGSVHRLGDRSRRSVLLGDRLVLVN